MRSTLYRHSSCNCSRQTFEDVQIAIGKALSQTVIGDPNVEGVRMGALAGKAQVEEVRNQIKKLLKETSIAMAILTK